jgi:gliding motility-associated-like protein
LITLYDNSMKLRKYIILVCLLFIALQNFATHIVGGEIYYNDLGSYKYYVVLKQYLDCCPTCTKYDPAAAVGVYDAQGKIVLVRQFPLLNVSSVPPTLYAKCFTIPSNICVNEIIYGDTLYLPPIPGGYSLSYQRCCRNADIINITDAFAVGSTYQTFINPSITNSSTRYNHVPPLLLCVGVPFVFDNSAMDPDRDSISYELCSPFEGADQVYPLPDTPSVPPYNFVQYNTPYSGSYPIASSPVFKIDPNTGIITGTPTMIGRFVVGVCAKEYRHGVYLGTNKRDYQFNVTNCPKSAKAYVNNQTLFCAGLTMNFSQNSSGGGSYHWDFGDPTTVLDTSASSTPFWTYPDTGTYTVTLIINPHTLCADTASAKVKIQTLLNPYFVPPAPKCMNEDNEGLIVLGNYTSKATYLWNFGPNATPMNSNKKDPGKIVYHNGGTFPIALTVTENGCTKTFTDSIKVFQKPEANYEPAFPVSCELQPVHFINKSKGPPPLDYSWSFGDELKPNKEVSPYHIYKKVGMYLTQLIVTTTKGCKDTFELPAAITVNQLPTAGFDINPKDTSVFYSTISFLDSSKNKTDCNVFWGDGSPGSTCQTGHTYTAPGTYQVMQIVENKGCFDTAYASVIVRPEFVFWLPNAFTPGRADDVNDVYKPTLYGVHDYRFQIFDRWGQLIFETSNPDEGWNGYINHRLCQQDVYVYKITFKDDVNLRGHQYIGHFTLVQ